MLQKKKDDTGAVPFIVAAFRAVHCVLFCYALLIIIITYCTNETTDMVGPTSASPERLFSLAVAAPMLLCSLFFGLSVTARALFGTGIFLCFLCALLLAMLPAMMNVFFPVHLYLFSLAAVYVFSGLILIRYFFSQPVQKQRWDDKKK